MMVPTLWQSCQAMPSFSMSLSLPTATVTPSTLATTPLPLNSWISVTRWRSMGPPWARCRLLLMGWEEAHSARAAYSSTFSRGS